MFTIHLHNLEFFSFHGLHQEETVLGNRFLVTLDVNADIPGDIKSVSDTIDYSAIYAIVKKHMDRPRPLLEQVASGIADEIIAMSSDVGSVRLTIKKMHAPIPQFRGEAGVSFSRTR